MRSLYVSVAFVIGLFFLASISVNAAMQGHGHGQKQGEIKSQNAQSKTKTTKPSKSQGWGDINVKRGVIQFKQ
ncbi:MAG TPA: hypothetical protein VG498_19190 [Terriglobales bacterium]|nr:hypothetical protein [Terriglobales bacterium]